MTTEIMPKCGHFYKRVKVGEVYGRLTVIELQKKSSCLCRCICGNTRRAINSDLTSGKIRSCGCLKRDCTIARNTTHGGASRGNPHPMYGLWSSMMNRCNNPGNKDYSLYGGRGISVCERWRQFDNFLEDIGNRPSAQHSLDRYPDKDGNYEPGNVRWATAEQQVQNCRTTTYIDGEPLQVVASRLGIKQSTLKARIRYGMTGDRLLFSGRHKSGPKPRNP